MNIAYEATMAVRATQEEISTRFAVGTALKEDSGVAALRGARKGLETALAHMWSRHVLMSELVIL